MTDSDVLLTKIKGYEEARAKNISQIRGWFLKSTDTLSDGVSREALYQLYDPTSDLFIYPEFTSGIDAFSRELDKPKFFVSLDHVHAYEEEAKEFMKGLESRYEEACIGFQAATRYREYTNHKRSFGATLKDNYLTIGAGIVAAIGFGIYLASTWSDVKLPEFFGGLIIAVIFGMFVSGAFALVFALIVIPVQERRRAHKISRTLYVAPKWLDELKVNIGKLNRRLEVAIPEMHEDAKNNKSLMRKARDMSVEDHFHERVSKRSSAERIEIIEAELMAASKTSKTLAEQHAKTEEIRLKYAKELIALQRQVKSEADADLTRKLAMVESLLGA